MKEQIYIFGAGEYGKKLLFYLKNVGVTVVAFIDNDEKKQNTIIEGIECISVNEAIERGGVQEAKILIPMSNSIEIRKQLESLQFKNLYNVNKWLMKKMYFEPMAFEKSDYINARPFNHYESPYAELEEIHRNEKKIFDRSQEVLDIDFNLDNQLKMITQMSKFELPGWAEHKNETPFRYYYENNAFRKGSADALYYMMRIIRPKIIIEIGSGFSTSVMLDTNETYFENKVKIISIEPRTARLRRLLKPNDHLEIYEKDLQQIPLSFFEILKEDDILFIDSSHVSKMNSDVNYLFFEIFPRLKRGVYIHFHDMFYPFIYPERWVYEGRAYNELYILRAFLMNNKDYSIQLFGSMLKYKCNNEIPKNMQGCGDGSLWIKKER